LTGEQASQDPQDPEETENGDGDDAPAIDDDEFADLDGIDPGDVEDQTSPDDADDDGDVVDDQDDADDSSTAPATTTELDFDGWGDQYCSVLTTLTNGAIDEFGRDGAEHVDKDAPKELDIDQHFDAMMRKRGASELSPEKALVISTSVFLITTLGTQTTLFNDILDDFDL
jgi:hypothetical protein